jgi:hypothetical protein
MATTVISANEGIHYLHYLVTFLPIIPVTIILLCVFAVLDIIGITESAKVAIGIFIFHLTSLVILSGFIIYFLLQNGITRLFKKWDIPINFMFIGAPTENFRIKLKN